MKCEIRWRFDMRRDEWHSLCQKCNHTTLLQSYPYAQAMREVHKQGARHGIIYINGVRAGIVQMQEVRLLGQLLHIISVDRGPLWFHGFGSDKHTYAFSQALNAIFPARLGRKRRFLPELSSLSDGLMPKNWKKSEKTGQYKTIIVDISPKIDEIRSNLKQKWRNILNKSEKQSITVNVDENLEGLGGFLTQYVSDRAQKGYHGASPKFLATLAKYAGMHNECLLMTASCNDETMAAILVYQHGHCAIYQAGWTTSSGRTKGAHHLLLWHAITTLKKRGVVQFDLGGYNENTVGIHKFKQGLGGQTIALIGSYY